MRTDTNDPAFLMDRGPWPPYGRMHGSREDTSHPARDHGSRVDCAGAPRGCSGICYRDGTHRPAAGRHSSGSKPRQSRETSNRLTFVGRAGFHPRGLKPGPGLTLIQC